MRISDWSSDVCSSDLEHIQAERFFHFAQADAQTLHVVVRDDHHHRAEQFFTERPRAFRRIDDCMQRKAPLSVIARRCCLPAEPQRHDASPALPRLFEQRAERSDEHTSELQSLMRISYA